MATLSTLLPNGNSVNGSRSWSAQSYLDIDEGLTTPDGSEISNNANATGVYVTSFLLSNVNADLSAVTALSWRVRYRVVGAQVNTRHLDVRIVRESDGTVLAAATAGGAYSRVASTITNTTATTSAVTAFAYVNTTATRAAWDDARLEFQEDLTKSMSGDTNGVAVDGVEITGTYDATVNQTVGAPNLLTAPATVRTPLTLLSQTVGAPVLLAAPATLHNPGALAHPMVYALALSAPSSLFQPQAMVAVNVTVVAPHIYV
jgi:hypothetical protein